ncbi:hypothetical protein GHI76_06110 [Neisseria meningitidis]|nr:hypothetical protein [Neisseria meningitidis]
MALIFQATEDFFMSQNHTILQNLPVGQKVGIIPAQAGIQSVRFQSFPIDSCRVRGSRFPLSRE